MDNTGIAIVMKYLFYSVGSISAAYAIGKILSLSLKIHKEKKDTIEKQ